MLRPACHHIRRRLIHGPRLRTHRSTTAATGPSLVTLAIETSCDDTAVAVLSRCRRTGRASLLFNERISSDNRPFKGVNPAIAVQGHNASLAPLVRRALAFLPDARACDGGNEGGRVLAVGDGECRTNRKMPDFVSVTRGPGIMANLAVGLNMAKGLAVAWDVPLLAVHHMQAHALTPRLVHALGEETARVRTEGEAAAESDVEVDTGAGAETLTSCPEFPFLSLLVSGGHTQLVHSTSLVHHRILANTADIAIGNLLDQTARVILPADVLEASPDVMYGRVLEEFAFPPDLGDVGAQHADFFRPATSRHDEMVDVPSGYSWTVPLPFRNSRKLVFSFSSIYTNVHRIAAANPSMDLAERRALARHTLRAAFQHLVSRLVLALTDVAQPGSSVPAAAHALVVAGGVASNRFLMHVLRSTLVARGFPDLPILAPPVTLCTDNAAMVAWTAVEMYDAGWASDLSVRPIGKWSMDPAVGEGILGVDGWLKQKASFP
ncbi:hypothetical protein DCS_05304 [Drechmeria coniospora]|uniref:Gcp-like domain-containing protein n=1 Tax=Drechmeria coniospora TaxID=98403 RepID=A0A151GMN8_DRECN|nr:hypothetical protein DCS_05304 [Drechmeria coniospora]KYK58291.1 hypothetical protein DCS_05304 [Drechmeria coniospora]